MTNQDILLITGGTGSFGKYFLRHLMSLPKEECPKKIIVYSRDEDKQYQQRQDFPDSRIEYFIGDIRDINQLKRAIKDVTLVIHAAALKQVPTGEFFPEEAVKTNVLGTQNVIEACKYANVRKAVLISTDKAVYPCNAYGMAKALAEKLFNAANQNSNTAFIAVRYGNVMGSRGSVIPLFLNKFANNEPLTVTDGSMTRFVLKLSEAVALVHHAIVHGNAGELFVKKAPACSVDTLIKAFEKVLNIKADIKVIGIRPGEKLHEALLSEEELANGIDVESKEGGKIFKVSNLKQNNINFKPDTLAEYISPIKVNHQVLSSDIVKQLTTEEVVELLISEKFTLQKPAETQNNKQTTVIIFGANGMLGGQVYNYLKNNKSFNTIGTSHRQDQHEYFEVKQNEAETINSLKNILDKYSPDYIINCIGAISQKTANNETKKLMLLNSTWPSILSEVAQKSKIIQIATDCVFSGKIGDYIETSPHDATDNYGKSKSLGEIDSNNTLNIRCSIIGFDKDNKSLLSWFMSQSDNNVIKGYENHLWNGVTTLQFAKICEDIISSHKFNQLRSISSVLHLTPNESISKYELLNIFKNVFNKNIIIQRHSTDISINRTLKTKYQNWHNLGTNNPIKTEIEKLKNFK